MDGAAADHQLPCSRIHRISCSRTEAARIGDLEAVEHVHPQQRSGKALQDGDSRTLNGEGADDHRVGRSDATTFTASGRVKGCCAASADASIAGELDRQRREARSGVGSPRFQCNK